MIDHDGTDDNDGTNEGDKTGDHEGLDVMDDKDGMDDHYRMDNLNGIHIDRSSNQQSIHIVEFKCSTLIL